VPEPLGISDDGKIVGTEGKFQGVLYEMGHFSALALPPMGNANAQPTGINDSGHIVGGVFNEIDNQEVAFYYNGMTYQFINPVFAKGGAVATGINNNEQVVGYYINSSNKNVGFLKDGNSYSDISDPLGISTFALSIDEAGEILGYYSDGAIDHGFIDSGGVFTTIDDPSATHGTIAYGADHVGAVAGTYFGSVPHGFVVDDPHGFIEENGNYMTLDDPLGADGTEVTGITFGGDVVGYYFTANVPEPSTWAMMLVGLGGLGFAGYRRTKKNANALAAV
jgi:PEP-CTERM motif